MRHYAQRLRRRVDAGGIEATTARAYYDWISGFLSWCVRDGRLGRNPALRDCAREAIDESDRDALASARDLAFVSVLAFSGVRGAEILRASGDARKGRRGLRWKRVDLDAGVLTLYGKGKRSDPRNRWEKTPLPEQARPAVRRYKRLPDPPSEEWPVFPTGHGPSKYRVARTVLARDRDLSRRQDRNRPRKSRRRRRSSRVRDRSAGGHRSQRTTRDAYSHIEAEERARRVTDIIEHSVRTRE
ncbi:hypothetical protein [Halegenticoccus tardaugens]|uniref:hypothetical protein n=1 Tax=Halegenticoccus tardaugens TaxID=2071624 RepID=UPI00100A4CC1|nr:hypothetical protein [Halegenticoccus tardaugens]